MVRGINGGRSLGWGGLRSGARGSRELLHPLWDGSGDGSFPLDCGGVRGLSGVKFLRGRWAAKGDWGYAPDRSRGVELMEFGWPWEQRRSAGWEIRLVVSIQILQRWTVGGDFRKKNMRK